MNRCDRSRVFSFEPFLSFNVFPHSTTKKHGLLYYAPVSGEHQRKWQMQSRNDNGPRIPGVVEYVNIRHSLDQHLQVLHSRSYYFQSNQASSLASAFNRIHTVRQFELSFSLAYVIIYKTAESLFVNVRKPFNRLRYVRFIHYIIDGAADIRKRIGRRVYRIG